MTCPILLAGIPLWENPTSFYWLGDLGYSLHDARST